MNNLNLIYFYYHFTLKDNRCDQCIELNYLKFQDNKINVNNQVLLIIEKQLNVLIICREHSIEIFAKDIRGSFQRSRNCRNCHYRSAVHKGLRWRINF